MWAVQLTYVTQAFSHLFLCSFPYIPSHFVSVSVTAIIFDLVGLRG